MASSAYRIESLTKNNYDTWCLQVQAVLVKNELWDYVSGEKCLTTTSTAEETEKFKKNDLLARAELLLLISPSELKQIKGCTTSKELWNKLKSIYQSQGPARKATLMKQLVLKKHMVSEDVRDHLNNFMDIVDKLADMDVKIHPDLLSIMMLYSLPASYENFRIAIESRDTLPLPEELKIKILEESEARKNANNDNVENDGGAFYTKKKVNKYCQKCKKKGHTTETCWSGKRDKVKKSNKVEKNYSITAINKSMSITSANVWCLDSGCTSHMCAQKEQFEEIQPESGTLKLASVCHTTNIEGKGKVSFELHDHIINLQESTRISYQ